MPFITDSNGNMKFVTEVPKPGPQPVAAASSGIVVQPVTVQQSGIAKPVQPVTVSETVNIAHDDVVRKVQVAHDFPPKPFRLKDYGL